MTPARHPRDAARFLRTLRVATQTAIAADDLGRGAGRAPSAGRFFALAAKGASDWRFPDAGLVSADGLLRANIVRQGAAAAALTLQALGASGLAAFAGRAARVRLGLDLILQGAFDRDGRLTLALPSQGVEEPDLARFEVDLLDQAD